MSDGHVAPLAWQVTSSPGASESLECQRIAAYRLGLRLTEGEPMYLEVIALTTERLGAVHPKTAQIKGAYARAVARHAPDRIDESRALLEEQLSVLRSTLGDQHSATDAARDSLKNLDPSKNAESTSESKHP